MTRLTLFILTLLFSLSGPAMGKYSDFGRSSLAAKKGAELATKALLREGDADLAVVQDGKLIAQTGNIMLSHKAFVARSLGVLPQGAEVVSIGKSGGQIYALTSKTFAGVQTNASSSAQAAATAAFR